MEIIFIDDNIDVVSDIILGIDAYFQNITEDALLKLFLISNDDTTKVPRFLNEQQVQVINLDELKLILKDISTDTLFVINAFMNIDSFLTIKEIMDSKNLNYSLYGRDLYEHEILDGNQLLIDNFKISVAKKLLKLNKPTS